MNKATFIYILILSHLFIFTVVMNTAIAQNTDKLSLIPDWSETTLGIEIRKIFEYEEMVNWFSHYEDYQIIKDILSNYGIDLEADVHSLLWNFGYLDFQSGGQSPEFAMVLYLDYNKAQLMQQIYENTGMTFSNFAGTSYIEDVGPMESPFKVCVAFPDPSKILITTSTNIQEMILLNNGQENPIHEDSSISLLLHQMNEDNLFWIAHSISRAERLQIEDFLDEHSGETAMALIGAPIRQLLNLIHGFSLSIRPVENQEQQTETTLKTEIVFLLQTANKKDELKNMLTSIISIGANALSNQGEEFYANLLRRIQIEEKDELILSLSFLVTLIEIDDYLN